MHNYQKINNISGWMIFAIATIVYWLTVEPTASYWDCGEFIAVSYKLEVPHPPGAPLFLLIGRMFSFLAGDNVEKVAYWINISSVIASGFTILFLFWSITLLGRKIFKIEKGAETIGQTIMLMGGAAIGALAYTFSDSFWFSAEEAEVYAMSSFFTAFVFWAILKWEVIEDESLANKWIILICYMMGLSIGVHLLNLVTIPALGLIYYFKKYEPTTKGVIITLTISGAILILINNIIIPGLPSMAGSLEIFFVNSMNMPFGSGMIFFGVLIIGSLVYGIIYSFQKEKVLLNTALLSLAFILIGYASYTIIVIRSNYNPPIDENNPENIISFVSYLKREQYGSRPLIYGQYFDAKVTDQKMGGPVYIKGKDKYEIVDYKFDYIYDRSRSTFLPRAYSSDPRHVQLYREYMGLGPNESPMFYHNIWYMMRYQIGHMYLRYFLWNFMGRESDIQHAGVLTPFDSLKDTPESISSNKARNNFFMLPLILGIIGMVFHSKRQKKDFWVVMALFVLTGVALVIYLNSPPVEPRERDYIYVGSYYAFAIWIGIGVYALVDWLKTKFSNEKKIAVMVSSVCLIVPLIMAVEGWDDHDRSGRYFSVDSAKNFLSSCAPNAILFTGGDNDTFPLWYAQEVEGFRTDVRVIVLSYFNTDWYIDQMTRNAYESQPLPFTLDSSHYRQGGPNDFLRFKENRKVDSSKPIELASYINLVRKNSTSIRESYGMDKEYNTIPSRTLSLDIDSASVVSKHIIPEDKLPYLTKKMTFALKSNVMEKNTLACLDIILTNKWERPIYFNSTSLQGIGIDVKDYVVQEGNTFRLLPLNSPSTRMGMVNTDIMYDNVMNKFAFRGLDDPNVYNSIDHRNFALNHRATFSSLASALIEEGKKDKAKEVMERCLNVIPDISIPYDQTAVQMVSLLFEIDEKEKAREIARTVTKRADETLTYFIRWDASADQEDFMLLRILNSMAKIAEFHNEPELAKEINGVFQRQLRDMEAKNKN